MTTLCLVPGTHGGAWAEPGSALRAYLEQLGFRCILFPWSYDVGGAPSLTDADKKGRDSDWAAGGYSTRFEILARGLRYADLNFAVHSHGIEPLIYQAVLPAIEGLEAIRIRSLISICSPPRADAQPLYQQARAAGMIGYHKHIHAIGWDFWARAGQAFDGHFGWNLEWKGADANVGIEGIGHTGLLEDPKWFARLAAELAPVVGSNVHV